MSVFLSSTSADLAEYRSAVREGLDRIGERVLRMETFGARPVEPLRACLDEIAESDIFVGIYAHRYGFVPPGAAASITELEYDRAVELEKAVFAFIVDDDVAWKPGFIDGEPGRSRLAALKQRISVSSTRETFTSPVDLALKVTTSIGNYLSKQQLKKHIPPPASAQAIGPENVALLHTSFRRPDKDEVYRDGRRYYQFEVIVMASDLVMQKIKSVTYRLENAWPEDLRIQKTSDRGSRFKLKELANGTSIVTATIEIAGQAQPLELNRFIDLRPDGPRL